MMLEKIFLVELVNKFDSNGNITYIKDSTGYEEWFDYDDKGNIIHYKNSSGYESWNEFDSNGNLIYSTDNNGIEYRCTKAVI